MFFNDSMKKKKKSTHIEIFYNAEVFFIKTITKIIIKIIFIINILRSHRCYSSLSYYCYYYFFFKKKKSNNNIIEKERIQTTKEQTNIERIET